MTIWPVIIDAPPSYLHGRGPRGGSLLLAPLGSRVLVEVLRASLGTIADNAPVVIAPEHAHAGYAACLRDLWPNARVVANATEFADAVAQHELSDALMFVNPRCMPMHGYDFSPVLLRHMAEPRVSHHLVAFERGFAGTKERVCFDGAGDIRGIQRHYEQATWPFIAGVAATMVPVACGVASDGGIVRSLSSLRELLIGRGVPNQDVPIDSAVIDLSEEHGLLAANEQYLAQMRVRREVEGVASCPLYVGDDHVVHDSARLMGPVVLHAGARIEAAATILGPAVVGAGAHIGANAVVAHAVIGADSIVPSGALLRDRAWFTGAETLTAAEAPRRPLSYSERLARLTLDSAPTTGHVAAQRRTFLVYDAIKRAVDVSAAALGVVLALPVLIVASAAIWLESGRPIFYGDRREGLGARSFRCWKFRTMFTGAHSAQRQLKALDHTDGPHFKVERDPRVTRVGRVLRALNLDEMPQLFNVLAGQMSLVGPRPSPFRENQVCVPWRAARLSVRPGITGFWQVCRHNRAAGDFHQWIEYDLLYVQHRSVWLDLKILAATVLTLGGKAAHVHASWLVRQAATIEEEEFTTAEAPRRRSEEVEQVA